MRFLLMCFLAFSLAVPATAEPIFNLPSMWQAIGAAFKGGASDPDSNGEYLPREAVSIGYGQTMRRAINSNDRAVLRATTDMGGRGVAVDGFKVRFRDLQDESRAVITLRDFQGNIIDRTKLPKLGKSANGALYTYSPDLGHERRAVTLNVRTFGGKNGDGNGWSARVHAEPGCQTSPSFMERRGRAPDSRKGKSSKGGKGKK